MKFLSHFSKELCLLLSCLIYSQSNAADGPDPVSTLQFPVNIASCYNCQKSDTTEIYRAIFKNALSKDSFKNASAKEIEAKLNTLAKKELTDLCYKISNSQNYDLQITKDNFEDIVYKVKGFKVVVNELYRNNHSNLESYFIEALKKLQWISPDGYFVLDIENTEVDEKKEGLVSKSIFSCINEVIDEKQKSELLELVKDLDHPEPEPEIVPYTCLTPEPAESPPPAKAKVLDTSSLKQTEQNYCGLEYSHLVMNSLRKGASYIGGTNPAYTCQSIQIFLDSPRPTAKAESTNIVRLDSNKVSYLILSDGTTKNFSQSDLDFILKF